VSGIKSLRENRHTNTPRTSRFKINASDGAPHVLFYEKNGIRSRASDDPSESRVATDLVLLISDHSDARQTSLSADRTLSCECSPNSAEVEEKFRSDFYCAPHAILS